MLETVREMTESTITIMHVSCSIMAVWFAIPIFALRAQQCA